MNFPKLYANVQNHQASFLSYSTVIVLERYWKGIKFTLFTLLWCFCQNISVKDRVSPPEIDFCLSVSQKISEGGYLCCIILDNFSCGLWGEFCSIHCQNYHREICANKILDKKQNIFLCLAIASINKKTHFECDFTKAVTPLHICSGFFHWVPEEVQQQ